ncbi:helix-turn-helix domain-containing protein [Argonema galeatum]|uniref:helix-turn-helix domain-containing protein n=1 Tax=Argonema galeatum TaxID=2942762 RepID=UPI002012AC20|nr:IS630 transposase-related protein [Argonema galeatum]MCL1463981.1 IS630 transposase-related protein [Argonema galeatum A003/A1]
MANTYSQDLRIRALDLILSGVSISQVSYLLLISRTTLYRWRQQFETTGSIAPQPRIPPPQPAKIRDWQKFKEFVDSHGELTQKELAQLWGDVSHDTISRGLKKLGYTRKKKLMPIKSAVKKLGLNSFKK